MLSKLAMFAMFVLFVRCNWQAMHSFVPKANKISSRSVWGMRYGMCFAIYVIMHCTGTWTGTGVTKKTLKLIHQWSLDKPSDFIDSRQSFALTSMSFCCIPAEPDNEWPVEWLVLHLWSQLIIVLFLLLQKSDTRVIRFGLYTKTQTIKTLVLHSRLYIS